MTKNILLVDYENRQNLDLSLLDGSYMVIIFVGHHQEEPYIKKKIAKTNRYAFIDYQKIDGFGKNALDFHIAFKLGQIQAKEPETQCYILSGDKGFDPLLNHFKNIGFSCTRVETILELPFRKSIKYGLNEINPELSVCPRCKKTETIPHNGGRWCTNCGMYASPPSERVVQHFEEKPFRENYIKSGLFCSNCSCSMDISDGIFDDGEWTCWACLGVG